MPDYVQVSQNESDIYNLKIIANLLNDPNKSLNYNIYKENYYKINGIYPIESKGFIKKIYHKIRGIK